MKYKIIYADPPWTYQDKANAGERGASHKYSTMSVAQLCALDIEAIAARDCLLAMWWVAPMPREALRVIDAWGFKLRTMKGFTWRKTTKHGAEHFGMGHWSRANTEDCLFATRGSPKRISAGVRQLISAQVREHSRKPDQVRDALVRLMGDVPRIELFARQEHAGWHAWGDQVKSNINMGNL